MKSFTARICWPSVLLRGTIFLAFWIVLTLGNPGDLAVGLIAAIVATLTSVYLLPAHEGYLSLAALIKFAFHFFYQSLVAGLDVAKRAFDPNLPLRPGYVQFPCKLAQGPTRSAFCALSSLLPGTVPVKSDQSGVVLVHCLDIGQPVVEQLTGDEILFSRIVNGTRDDG
jgi:multicomponent Na+:H+ antiporter subunit E